MTLIDDPAADMVTPPLFSDAETEDEERELFGPVSGTMPAPEEKPAGRGKPGPAPNPNSARQRKLREAAERRKTAAAPKRRPEKKPPTPAAAKKSEPTGADEVMLRGAQTVLGWVARPLALSATGLAVAAGFPGKMPAERRMTLARNASALQLDAMTIAAYEEPLTQGLAELAPSVPWLQATLERAAKISPYATILEAGVGLVFQVLANHGVMPVSKTLGTLGPEDLMAAAGIDPNELAEG